MVLNEELRHYLRLWLLQQARNDRNRRDAYGQAHTTTTAPTMTEKDIIACIARMETYDNEESANKYWQRNKKTLRSQIRHFRSTAGNPESDGVAGRRVPFAPIRFRAFYKQSLIGDTDIQQLCAYFNAWSDDDLAGELGQLCALPCVQPLSKWLEHASFPSQLQKVAQDIRDEFEMQVVPENDWREHAWKSECAHSVLPNQAVYIRYSSGKTYGQQEHCDGDAKFFSAVLLLEACEDERNKGMVVPRHAERQWQLKPGSVVFLAPNTRHHVAIVEREYRRSVIVFTF